MGMMKVGIVVDTGASLPSGMGQADGVYAAPMTVTLDGVAYLDGLDITPTEFYRLMRASSGAATTAAPSAGRYEAAFGLAAARYDAIVCITTGGRFSASLDAARAAAADMKLSMPGLDIRVLDSQGAAGSQGLAATAAWRAARAGGSVDDVVAAAERVVGRARLLAFVDTLRYLRRGGRVGGIADAGAALLRIRPLFELAGGEVRTVARPRTRRGALRRLVELMPRDSGLGALRATVMHSDAADGAEEVRGRIAAEFDCAELYVSEFTPAMGAHTGPGMVGVAFWNE